MRDLEATVRSVPCDTVVMGTPIDLTRVMKIDKPYVRVAYELEEVGTPTLGDVLTPFLKEVKKGE